MQIKTIRRYHLTPVITAIIKKSVYYSLNHVRLLVTPWTVAHQAPLSMEFSRQEYWSGFPFLSPGDLTDPGVKPGSPAFQADSLPPEPPGKPSKKSTNNKYWKHVEKEKYFYTVGGNVNWCSQYGKLYRGSFKI